MEITTRQCFKGGGVGWAEGGGGGDKKIYGVVAVIAGAVHRLSI